ncbi:MAG: AI-2E family transporter, partial [Paracoccus sp. (in: a-proteobacteria)]|nr:AI-2E family transporter [Paracoccus sp. (in: a-proteobacteria)]
DTAIYVALLFTAIQMFEGNVLMPLIQSYAVQLPPALTIVAIMAFGGLFGFAGVILAAPLLIVAMLLIHRIYIEDILGDTDQG